MSLIHTDLKPENILLVSDETYPPMSLLRSSEIRVIDFGSATFEYQHHSSLITTRHYRAPEVILGNGWSYPADMWSLGCILFELYTGRTLFQTHDDHQHLAMMQARLGPFPLHMIFQNTGNCRKYYDTRGRVCWPKMDDPQYYLKIQESLSWIPLQKYFPPEHMILFSLISQLLVFDPAKRVTAAEALRSYFGVD